MGAHGEGGEDDVVGLLRADRDDDDFGRMAGFGQLHGGFDGVLVEGVHRHAHVLGLDARAIGADTHAHRVIDHALDGNEDFHRASSGVVPVIFAGIWPGTGQGSGGGNSAYATGRLKVWNAVPAG